MDEQEKNYFLDFEEDYFYDQVTTDLKNGHTTELFDRVKNFTFDAPLSAELLSLLKNLNSDYIFNGLVQNECDYFDEEHRIKYANLATQLFPESQKIITEAKFYLGLLTMDEIYECLSDPNFKHFVSKDVFQDSFFTNYETNRFYDLAYNTNNTSLMETLFRIPVYLSYNQFLAAVKKFYEPSTIHDIPYYSEAEEQLKLFMPLSPEREKDLMPYCESQIRKLQLTVTPTYDAILYALVNNTSFHHIKEAIINADFLTDSQLASLVKLINFHKKRVTMYGILDKLVSHPNCGVETLQEVAKTDVSDIGGVDYQDFAEEFIKKLRTIPLTEEQKSQFKLSKKPSVFDALSSRDDFTFEDAIDLLNNGSNFYIEDLDRNVVDRFIACAEEPTKSENEVALSKFCKSHWTVTQCLVNLDCHNPEPNPKVVIECAKCPLDTTSMRRYTPTAAEDFKDTVTLTNFTDEQFNEILQIANNYEPPTDPYVIECTLPGNYPNNYQAISDRARDAGKWKEFDKALYDFQNKHRWSQAINSGLLLQTIDTPELTDAEFDRVVQIFEAARTHKTKFNNPIMDRIAHNTFTVDNQVLKTIERKISDFKQMEKLAELGVPKMNEKLQHIRDYLQTQSNTAPTRAALNDISSAPNANSVPPAHTESTINIINNYLP
ncbi:MAG: hypothetical protein LBM38_03065 [Clostridiales bacterium]|jgi:hypothetical protein|nr:hypothetical protein [Clostridiales bacterium]